MFQNCSHGMPKQLIFINCLYAPFCPQVIPHFVHICPQVMSHLKMNVHSYFFTPFPLADGSSVELQGFILVDSDEETLDIACYFNNFLEPFDISV